MKINFKTILMWGVLILLSSFSFPASAQEVEEDLTGQDVKTMTVRQVADYYKLDVEEYIAELKAKTGVTQIEGGTDFQLLHDNFGLTPSLAKDIAVAMVAEGEGNKKVMITLEDDIKKESKTEKNYNFPVIAVTLVSLYLGSLLLVKQKVLSIGTQRMVWNMALGTFFIITAVLGILLVLRISHRIIVPLPFNMIFWHVETGIAFSVIALFHILWHSFYFRAILKKIGGVGKVRSKV